MTRAIKAGLVALSGAALLLALALPGSAQSRGGARSSGGMSRGFSGVSRPPAARVAPRMASPVTRSFAPRSAVRTRSFNSIRPAGNRFGHDHHGHRRHAGYALYPFPGYPGYYYYYPFDYGYDSGFATAYDTGNDNGYGNAYGNVPDDTTQQPTYAQQPIYPPQPEPYAVEQPAPAPNQYAVAAPAAPQPDPGEFILVRKDGRVVLASAFTLTGDQLIYITREGLRRSFPVAELDKDTTRKMNDAYGTTLVLPG